MEKVDALFKKLGNQDATEAALARVAETVKASFAKGKLTPKVKSGQILFRWKGTTPNLAAGALGALLKHGKVVFGVDATKALDAALDRELAA